jgi:hypothetical protein
MTPYQTRHQTLGRGYDGHSHATEHPGNLGAPDKPAQTRGANLPQSHNDGFAISVLEGELQSLLDRALNTHVSDVAFALQNLRDGLLHLRVGKDNRCMSGHSRIADPSEEIRDGIVHGGMGLPTGLNDSRNLASKGQFTKGETRDRVFADERMTTPGKPAPVHHPNWAGILRQLGESRIVTFSLQLRTDRGVLLYGIRLFLVAGEPGFFGHMLGIGEIEFCYFENGMPISLSRSYASSFVGAVVTMVMSIP